MNPDDTIVAISSPPGGSVRGIVRLSGPDAFDIAAQVFVPHGVTQAVGRREQEMSPAFSPGHTCRIDGHVAVAGGTLPAQAWTFPRPRSYTRQDTVEFHLVGSPVILGMLVEACLARGARSAQPGEFTARAFLAGALDLSQVHGVAGLIAARSDLQVAAAERLLHGSLADTANAAREDLADLSSLVEGAMDFADEPIEFITPAALRARLSAVLSALEGTLGAGLRAERWTRLPQVVLTGAPNAGKSSLLNRLTGMDRAITAPVAGTTRDVVTAPLSLGEFECLLVDIAGLEAGASELDRAAQSAADRARHEADLLLHVVDATDSNAVAAALAGVGAASAGAAMPGAAPTAELVLVLNKIDLLDAAARQDLIERLARDERDALAVSAVTAAGCDALVQAIAARLGEQPHDARDPAIALMAEHRAALERAIEALRRAIELTGNSGKTLADADLVATELRLAADGLGELVGRDQTEELLGRIFSRFCVGK